MSADDVSEGHQGADKRFEADGPARAKVLYLLYTGDLYGTEQMAITHLRALQEDADVLIVAPEGPLHAAAANFGIRSVTARSPLEVLSATLRFARRPGPLTVLTASLGHSMLGLAATSLFGWRRTRHFNICHGGADLAHSYSRKRVFNRTPVRLVAVSHYCAGVLRGFGVSAHRISVVANFLPDERCPGPTLRPERPSARLRVIAVTRLVPVKRLDLLIEALRLQPALANRLSVTIVGAGGLLDALRASAEGLDVTFTGFRGDVDQLLAASDIFVQTCAVESFGLAVAEAMAAGVFVISPDCGGAAEIVGDEGCGLLYRSDDASALADALWRAAEMPPAARAAVASAGAERIRTHYSLSARRQRLLELFLDPADPKGS